MSRLTISNKVFLLFFLLTGFTLLLGTAVFVGIRSLNIENEKLHVIRDFQFQINRVDTILHDSLQHRSPFDRELFSAELDDAMGLEKDLESLVAGDGRALVSALLAFPEHLRHYKEAYEELNVRYEKERAYMLIDQELRSSLEKKWEGFPPSVQSGLFRVLRSYSRLQDEFLETRGAESVREIKELYAAVKNLTGDRNVLDWFGKLIQNAENRYFNFLAINDREQFLKDTSNLFARVTEDIISSVSLSIDRKQFRLKATIFVIILLSIMATATFWLLVSRYIGNFIGRSNRAIRSIQAGEYDYPVDDYSRDEFGELLEFMKKMSLNLKANINKVRNNELFLQNIIDGIGEPILLVGLDHRIQLMNRKAREASALPGTDMESLTCHLFSHSIDSPCSGNDHPCPMNDIILKKEPVIVEHEHFDAQGETRNIEIMASPLFGEDGAMIGMIEASRDITDRKRLEEQLRQSQKMEVIGRLAGGIAHDFNNLLTIILGYSEIALSSLQDDSPVSDNIKAITSAGERAAALTSQLLAFSRKQVLHVSIINLNDIIEDMTQMLKRVIGENIKIMFRPDRSIANIRVDQGQIEQVIMNIAVNARDAMPSGGSLIMETGSAYLDAEYTKGHKEAKPGPYSVITMADTGSGITKELQEKIFEPFFTTKEQGKGTGLGLATVFGIVKQHEGHIFVYSEPGKGTSFKIYFPEAEGVSEYRKTRSSTALPTGDETILVVDDMDSIRRLVMDTLRPLGYQVLEASSGENAVHLIKEGKQRIDLLLSDVIMPGMSGSELASIIQETNPEIRTIFMSGYTDSVITHKGVMKEGIIFLHKPLMPSDLARKIREVLDDV